MFFSTSLPIRFGHEDHAQLVYFPRFLHFFHCAFEDLFDHNEMTYRHCLTVDRVGWPAVHVDVDFHSPLRFGDRFDVDVSVPEIGNKSAEFRYEGKVDGREVASGRIRVVCVDMDSFSSRAIPPKYRSLFERFPGATPTT